MIMQESLSYYEKLLKLFEDDITYLSNGLKGDIFKAYKELVECEKELLKNIQKLVF